MSESQSNVKKRLYWLHVVSQTSVNTGNDTVTKREGLESGGAAADAERRPAPPQPQLWEHEYNSFLFQEERVIAVWSQRPLDPSQFERFISLGRRALRNQLTHVRCNMYSMSGESEY